MSTFLRTKRFVSYHHQQQQRQQHYNTYLLYSQQCFFNHTKSTKDHRNLNSEVVCSFLFRNKNRVVTKDPNHSFSITNPRTTSCRNNTTTNPLLGLITTTTIKEQYRNFWNTILETNYTINENSNCNNRISNSSSIRRRQIGSCTFRSFSSQSSGSSIYTKEQVRVIQKYNELNQRIMELNQQWNGPLVVDPHYHYQATTDNNNNDDSGSNTKSPLPVVLILGNHSSGKSTFCNYILGRTIQTSGVAPTDDCFTVIVPGPNDTDQDGIALCSNPEFGFTSLQQFGPTLLHHTILKVRKDTNVRNFIVIDSPGMIDAPGNYYQSSGGTSSSSGREGASLLNTKNDSSGSNSSSMIKNQRDTTMDRGYDFTGVVKYLANRADVVLLFFDPDKPGTTGETLSVLLHALNGMDHKLCIVLNKADQFHRIHDFARAYGSLCWNLSKVIPRKDLPKIYTMCLPTATSATSTNITTTNDEQQQNCNLNDLYSARDEVVSLVMKAPERRMDNNITDLQQSIYQLRMHGLIIQDIQTRWSNFQWTLRKRLLSIGVSGSTLTGLSYYVHTLNQNAIAATAGSVPILPGMEYVTGIFLGGTILLTSVIHWYQQQLLQEYKKQNIHTNHGIVQSFQRTHKVSIQNGDEYIGAIWQQISEHLHDMVVPDYHTVSDVPVITNQQIQELNTMIMKEIPTLRQLISPQHYYSSNSSSNDNNNSTN